ncbi:ArsC/Spx/MgsR family protein [Lactococcus garvieae]|uniref:ArsC/Spx/MgsR family protein n=1 Tax=Lactococcus garvieae TaxID=1363 RepID=UPI00324629FB
MTIRLYSRGSCGSSRRALEWFEKYGLEIESKNLNKLTREDLIHFLSLSDEGIPSVMKREGGSRASVQKAMALFKTMTFNEAVLYLLSHTDLIRSPLVLEKNKHMIGYNEEEVQKFLPKAYRRQKSLR